MQSVSVGVGGWIGCFCENVILSGIIWREDLCDVVQVKSTKGIFGEIPSRRGKDFNLLLFSVACMLDSGVGWGKGVFSGRGGDGERWQAWKALGKEWTARKGASKVVVSSGQRDGRGCMMEKSFGRFFVKTSSILLLVAHPICWHLLDDRPWSLLFILIHHNHLIIIQPTDCQFLFELGGFFFSVFLIIFTVVELTGQKY